MILKQIVDRLIIASLIAGSVCIRARQLYRESQVGARENERTWAIISGFANTIQYITGDPLESYLTTVLLS